MREYKSIIINSAYIIIGITLAVLSITNKISDYFLGFAGGLIGAGALLLFRAIKYKTNSEYKEMIETEKSDERNRYISMKAWSISAYIFVMICAVITIVCMIMSKSLYMQISASAICVMLLLYCISYWILKRKY